ncbi:hypothetical protein ACJX0J_006308, partial [Zea mays]
TVLLPVVPLLTKTITIQYALRTNVFLLIKFPDEEIEGELGIYFYLHGVHVSYGHTNILTGRTSRGSLNAAGLQSLLAAYGMEIYIYEYRYRYIYRYRYKDHNKTHELGEKKKYSITLLTNKLNLDDI